GLRSLDEAIGRVDLLARDRAIDHWKARGVDLTHVLTHIELGAQEPRRRVEPPPRVLDDALDWELVERARAVIEDGGTTERVSTDRRSASLRIEMPIRNSRRCVGGILSSHIARVHGAEGLPEDSINVTFEGSAGQSFGAWLAPGVTFTLFG